MIRAAWDLLMHVVNTSPVWGWPMAAALVLAILLAQTVKPWLPEGMSRKQRHRVTQVIAVACGLLTSFVLWPAELHWKHGAVVGAIVGLSALPVYAIGVRALGHYVPWLRDWLSGDRQNTEEMK